MAVRLGYIGAGNIIRGHLRSTKELGLEPVGVYDIVPSIGETVAREFGVGKVCYSLEELLAIKDIDAVVVGTPNKFHAEQAVAALQAGKHVLLEKPMAMNAAECDRIIAARNKTGKIVQIGMAQRFRGSSQTLKKLVQSGACGDIYAGQSYWYRRRGIPGFGSWFTLKEFSGGGGLIDIGVHMLDLAMYLMGFPKPVAVSGATYNVWKDLDSYLYTSMWAKPVPGGKKDVDDFASAMIRFDQGQTLQLSVSWAMHIGNMDPEMGVRLMGDKGGVELKGMDNPVLYSEQAGHITDVKLQYKNVTPMVEEMRHFVECIADNRQPIATPEQGRAVQSVLDAIYRSSAEGREVRLDG